jgi:hypothetical protein
LVAGVLRLKALRRARFIPEPSGCRVAGGISTTNEMRGQLPLHSVRSRARHRLEVIIRGLKRTMVSRFNRNARRSGRDATHLPAAGGS